MTMTTAQMDGWTSDPDDPERYQVYVQCMDCTKWTFIQGTKENYGNVTTNSVCEHCDSSRLSSQSVTSKRTYDPEKAKRRKVR